MAKGHEKKTRAKKGAAEASAGGAADLAAVMDDALAQGPVLAAQDPAIGDPRTIRGEEIGPGGWRNAGLADLYGMPPECPVTPLGQDGLTFYFLTPLNQIVGLPVLKADHIQRLFAGRLGYLHWAWPRWRKVVKEIDPESGDETVEFRVDDWNAKQAQTDLYNACAGKGVWRDFELVRGRGAWREDDGSLTFHCGDVLVRADRDASGRPNGKLQAGAPGDYGQVVYPGGPPMQRPWGATTGEDPARTLMALFESWPMRRAIDRKLLLGWVLAAMTAGALPWKPGVYINGPRGSGKSTLVKKLLRELFSGAALYTTNATAAGLYQLLGQDARPVILDEFEAGQDSSRVKAVQELHRAACSEGVVLRGGQDHKGVNFQARSCFLFSSILRPAMRPADMSRNVFIQLDRHAPEAREPDLNPAELRLIGRKLMRRAMDRWDEFYPAYAMWHEALMRAGHDSRGADQFGILMAWADLALHDGAMDAAGVETEAELLAPSQLGEVSGQLDDHERCLNHLLSAPVQAWRGGAQPTVGRVLEAFLHPVEEPDAPPLNVVGRLKRANGLLAAVGMKIETKQSKSGFRTDVNWWLAIPSNDEKLRNLFEETDWYGERGVDGVWSQALQGAPRSMWESRRSTIDGRQRWCTWMDIEAILETGDADEMMAAAMLEPAGEPRPGAPPGPDPGAEIPF